MTLLRIYRGVVDHFPIRVTEWIMLWPPLGLAAVLQLMPDMFEVSPSYAYLARWASERSWAWIFIGCSLMRLAALVINGTFAGFAFSPHIRAVASVVGVAIWSQVSLGFLMAALYSGGALSGVIGWSTMVLLEIVNVYRSWSDVGKNLARR
jgi:hypothetical protein